MAVRYVKDFEFPSAAGYSQSSPSKVTGQMLAKGGPAKPAKGMMVVIGIGKPKHDMPATKAKGGKVEKVMHEFGQGKLHSGSKKGPKVTNPKQAVAIALNQAGKSKKAKGGIQYDDNGPDTSVPVSIKGTKKQSTDQDFYGKAKDAPMPSRRPAMMKKGGMQHDDVSEDTALIKKMVKSDALKKASGGSITNVQPRSLFYGSRQTDPTMASTMPKKRGGVIKKADGGMIPGQSVPPQQMAAQLMAARARNVPVAPRSPMIAPQGVGQAMSAPPAMGGASDMSAPVGGRIGVGKSRPGQPNVGAIRAAMARAASQAQPAMAPSMMKKGGKVKC